MTGLLEGFEKINTTTPLRVSSEKGVHIREAASGSKVYYARITGGALKEAGINTGDRVDLYCSNGTFAFKKSDSGVYKVYREGKFTGRINSTPMCREIKVRSGDAVDFTAWGIAEAGVLFFKVKETE